MLDEEVVEATLKLIPYMSRSSPAQRKDLLLIISSCYHLSFGFGTRSDGCGMLHCVSSEEAVVRKVGARGHARAVACRGVARVRAVAFRASCVLLGAAAAQVGRGAAL